MTDTADFFTALYDKLAETLGAASTERDATFLQLAWPGYSLGPADFKRPDAPDGPYDANAARETVSQLANIAPVFSRARFENSGFEVDDLYEILISSAIPAGAALRTLRKFPVYKLFSDARYEFSQAKRGSLVDPGGFYYPCAAVPTRWYDEASSDGWRSLSFRSSELQPLQRTAQLAGSGVLEAANNAVWRSMPSTGLQPLSAAAAPPPPSAATGDPDAARFQPPRAPENAAQLDPVNPSHIDASRMDWGVKDVKQRLDWQSQIMAQLPGQPASAGTRNFEVSFKACKVSLTRPWLKLALLSTPSWWMYDTEAGAYSSGSAELNAGLFPMLTTSFIAVRDLQLTAAWSAEDRERIAQAVAFGCFDIRGAVMNGSTLQQSGLQIIAWTSRVLPKLPPISSGTPSRVG